MENKIWGWELIVDVKSCDVGLFTRSNIAGFTEELVKRIDMKAYGAPIIEHFANHDPSKGGYSLVQLIETSNICAHFVDLNGDAYFNVFSCKDFDPDAVSNCIIDFFAPESVSHNMITRG